jgi:hypothetical protein
MRPVKRRVLKTAPALQIFPIMSVICKISGSVKKLGIQYSNATIGLFNKDNYMPIAFRKPDQNGNYSFFGLNSDLKTFIVAFDSTQQFNAVIQDNVRPK